MLVGVAVLFAAVLAGALFLAERFATARAVDGVAARARASAILLASGYRREIDKFNLLPIALAGDAFAQADANGNGDIFGGWIMSLMDAAGAMTATRCAGGRVVTAAVTETAFLRPVKVGDVVCCYTEPVSTGRSSIALHVEVWVLRQGQGERVKVTAAEFTFVALDDRGKPRALEPA